MTGKELAEGLGISQAMVSRLIKRGMPDDSIDRARRWRNRNMQRGRMKGVRLDTRPVPDLKAGPTPGTASVDPAPELFDQEDNRDDDEREFDDYREARNRREHFQAEMARLAYLKEVKELMLASEVIETITLMATQLRVHLEELPAQLAPMLAPLSSEHDIQSVLSAHIEGALSNLAIHFDRLAVQAEG